MAPQHVLANTLLELSQGLDRRTEGRTVCEQRVMHFCRTMAYRALNSDALLLYGRGQVCTATLLAAMTGFMTSTPSRMGKGWSTGETNTFLLAPTSVAAR